MSVMRTRTTPVAIVVGALLVGTGVASSRDAFAAGSPDDGGTARQRVIVHLAAGPEVKATLRPEPGLADRRRLAAVAEVTARAEAELKAAIPGDELRIERAFLLQPALVADVSHAGLAALARSPLVRHVEPDRRWHIHTAEGLTMIGADVLHDLGIAGEGTAVAIVDTGVDYLHPTLGGGQIPNAKVVYGLDTADGDADPMDCDGHGTAVASVAAGSSYQWSPGRRFAGGVAPATKVLAYKVTPDDDCRTAATSAVVAALEDAVLQRSGADYRLAAINISLGGGAYSGPCDSDNRAYAAAVDAAVEAGITVVASAGNDGFTDSLSAPACLTGTVAVASAWDADPGEVGYSFCLDPQCSRSCDDSFRWQGAVACYANSSPYLDLVAPSEYLRAAAAGGITLDFGGTSGAAAYVTGAAALIAQALPENAPAATRFLLAATGRPTMDDRNGLVRPIVDLAAALDEAARVGVVEEPSVAIPASPLTPLVSPIDVDTQVSVGNLEVFVDLAHPRPEELRVLLAAPDGTEVVLHDRGPGTTPVTAGGVRTEGLKGSYPNDLVPAQSLGRFGGAAASGRWTLVVEDHGSGPAGGGDARLLGWALKITPPVTDLGSDSTMVFPVVARTEGANGTVWRSDLRIFNASTRREAELRLLLVPDADDETLAHRQTEVVVPHRSVLRLDDVVAARFGLESGRGSLLVQDPQGEVNHGSSRTYTLAEQGTFGQLIPALVGRLRSTGAGEAPLVLLPLGGHDRRVNVGCTEVAGALATVAVTLIDSTTGIALGPSSFHIVEAHRNLQINGVLPDHELPSGADPYLTVTVVNGTGRVVAYASVVDNGTGDAVFIAGDRPEVVPSLLVPVVARIRGQAGTDWRSDLRVLNHGSFSLHVDAELRFSDAVGLPPVLRSFELQPGAAAGFEDVVGSLFGFDQVQGSLRLVPREGPASLCAVSRTANHVSDGTYGQFVPAVPHGRGLTGSGVLLHLEKNDRNRSNVGLVEAGGQGVRLRLQLRDEIGRALGTVERHTLGPWESVQINDIFAALAAPAQDNAYLEVVREGGSGEFFAYASVIDGDSGDAVFVPAIAIPEHD